MSVFQHKCTLGLEGYKNGKYWSASLVSVDDPQTHESIKCMKVGINNDIMRFEYWASFSKERMD